MSKKKLDTAKKNGCFPKELKKRLHPLMRYVTFRSKALIYVKITNIGLSGKSEIRGTDYPEIRHLEKFERDESDQ